MDGFYKGGLIGHLPHDLAMLIDSQVQKYQLGTTILVAGVDVSGSHIYCIDDPGTMACFDRVGYHAIGIGHRHAVLKLVSLGQHQSKSVNETVFSVYCAKRVAELAPGVGQSTTMQVVTGRGTQLVTQDILDALIPAYEEHANPGNGAVEKAITALPFDSEGGGDGAN